MKKMHWDRKFIVFKLPVFVIVLIFLQSLFLIGTMVAGGVLTQEQESAFQFYSEQVYDRKDFIQREVKNRWTNMDQDEIFASVEKLGLYNLNTPFENEVRYVVGLMDQNNLLRLVIRIQTILLMSFLGSLLIGAIGGYFISYKYTKPINNLANQVRHADMSSSASFNKTGLSQNDELSHAMEIANNNLLDSTVKMSRIINLVGVAIGAFEYNNKSKHVFATDQLQKILCLNEEEANTLYHDKELFIMKLQLIIGRPEPEEDDVYIVRESPQKWVRIKKIGNDTVTLGIIMDITEEIQEKNRIKIDRDNDSLTEIYNRSAFQRQVISLSGINLKVAALIMLDLDCLKQINDKYGHKWGDIYIKTTAMLLSKFSEETSIIGRRSGDEFVVFLYGFDHKDEIIECIHHFYYNLDKNPIEFPHGKKMTIMISAGLVWCGEYVDETNYDELLQNADNALYEAKMSNKGKFCEYKVEN